MGLVILDSEIPQRSNPLMQMMGKSNLHHMKTFFYICCAFAVVGLVGVLFNPSQLFTCLAASALAIAAYPEVKQKDKKSNRR